MKLICLSKNWNLNEEFNQQTFNELTSNQVISFNPHIESFRSYKLKLLESEDADTILIGIFMEFSNNVIGTNQLTMTFISEEMKEIVLDETRVSLKMLNYYILDDSARSTINASVSLSVGGSVASVVSTYIISFLHSDSSFAFQTLMVIEYIYILRYIDLNYPPNAIGMFENKIEPSKFFMKKPIQVDPKEKKLIEGILELYEVNPYFLNNYGEILINFSIIFLVSQVFNLFFHYINTKHGGSQGFIMKILKAIHETLVWSIIIIYLSSNYLNLCFFSTVNLAHRPLSSHYGLVNFTFGVMAFVFAFGTVVYIFFVVKIIKINSSNIKKESLNKVYDEETAKNAEISFTKFLSENLKKTGILPLQKREKSPKSSQDIYSSKTLAIEKDTTNSSEVGGWPLIMRKKKELSIFSSKSQTFDSNRLTSPEGNPSKIFPEIFNGKENEPIQKNSKLNPKASTFKSNKSRFYVEKVEELIEKYDILYNDFKQNTRISHYLVIFDLFRYYLIGIAVVVAGDHHIFLLCLLLALNSCFLLFLLICFPFKEKSKNILVILTEMSNVLATAAALCIAIWDWTENYDPYMRMNAGWAIVYANLFLILQLLLSFLVIIFQFLCKVYQKFKEMKNQRNKVWSFDPKIGSKARDEWESPERLNVPEKDFKEKNYETDLGWKIELWNAEGKNGTDLESPNKNNVKEENIETIVSKNLTTETRFL